MKKNLILLILFIVNINLHGISIEIDEVLDAPGRDIHGFYADSASYALNGQLLFMSRISNNIFILKDNKWEKLISSFETEEYNLEETHGTPVRYSELFDSKNSGEFLYFLGMKTLPEEYYRVFLDDKNELRSESVSKDYYQVNKLWYLSRGWNIREGTQLNDGFRIKLDEIPDTGEGSLYLPNIVDRDGNIVYRIEEDFNEAFVEDIMTITTNPQRDRVAMVISFKPLEDSPYFSPGFKYLKKLVIFKINYESMK